MHNAFGVAKIKALEYLEHVYLDVQVSQFAHDVFETDWGEILKDETGRLAHPVNADIQQLDNIDASCYLEIVAKKYLLRTEGFLFPC
jgi:hypothetical protein